MTVSSAIKLLIFCITAVACLSATPDTSGSPTSQHLFMWQQANSKAMAATTPDEYLEAAQLYNRLVMSGIRNGPLLYNLGTSLLKAGRHTEATQCLVRAERYMGADVALRRNLAVAMAGKTTSRELVLPWSRAAFFWHYGLPSRIRWNVSVAAFLASWICLVVMKFGFRKTCLRLLILSIAITIIFGTSSLTSIYQEANAPQMIVELPKTDGITSQGNSETP